MKSLMPVLCVIAIVVGLCVFAAADSNVPPCAPTAAYVPPACAPAAAYVPPACAPADQETTYVEEAVPLLGRVANLLPGHARRVARRTARAAAMESAETEVTYVEATPLLGRAVSLIPGHARRAARRDARHQQ